MKRPTERVMAEIHHAMADREFSSQEEANDFLQSFVEKQNEAEAPDLPLSPREAAQELIYDAWEEPTRRRRIALAKKALKLSADCADAYVILAEDEAEGLEEEARLYAEGVKAGERALGPEGFKKAKGHFWGILETRPYMRARFRLATVLWDLGQRAEAIGHLRDMLRLDPGDHLGVRYLLERAFRANPFVAALMLGAKKPPKRLADSYALGSEDEAVYYLLDGAEAWVKTPGAGDWFVEQLTAMMRKEKAKPRRS